MVAALVADPRVRMVNFTGSTNISRDLRAALDVVARVRPGIIHINDQGIGDEPMAPFGGVKNSSRPAYPLRKILTELTASSHSSRG